MLIKSLRPHLLLLLTFVAALSTSCGAGFSSGATPTGPGPWSDFPSRPILDASGATQLPSSVADLFSKPNSANPPGGPCLLQPEANTLLPTDWLRLRVTFVAPSEQNIFEIRIHVRNQINDLLVYTTAQTWTMPPDMWNGLTQHSTEENVVVTVRGVSGAGGSPSLASAANFTIAPVAAGGSVVYWTSSGTTALRGFKIGEETVHDVLKPAQATGGTQCIGCHSSTPDGTYVGFSQSTQPGDGSFASIGLRSIDGKATEPTLTQSARALLSRTPQQLPTFSPMHWSSGDLIALSTLPLSGRYEIVWTNLEATSQAPGVGWGLIARLGDSNQAATPVFSHSGKMVVYTSEATPQYGVISTNGDVVTVPYGTHSGGKTQPVPGASDPAYNEFYPAFSPDDALLAFNRVPTGMSSYNNVASEIYVVPTVGGTATRLVGNDPPVCSGRKSPGVYNSWPKWSPETRVVGARQYYWVSFSSIRVGAMPQLYVIGVVVEAGVVKSYGAAYLWNQPASDSNHTAAWDVFRIG